MTSYPIVVASPLIIVARGVRFLKATTILFYQSGAILHEWRCVLRSVSFLFFLSLLVLCPPFFFFSFNKLTEFFYSPEHYAQYCGKYSSTVGAPFLSLLFSLIAYFEARKCRKQCDGSIGERTKIQRVMMHLLLRMAVLFAREILYTTTTVSS